MGANPLDFDEIVRSILENAAGLEARPPLGQAPRAEQRYLAEVRYQGDRCGRVRVRVAAPLARQLASAMQRRPQDDLHEDLVMDAVGELANMIAGNLRPMLEGARSVGLPKVTRGVGRPMGDATLVDRSYDCGGRTVEVELLAS